MRLSNTVLWKNVLTKKLLFWCKISLHQFHNCYFDFAHFFNQVTIVPSSPSSFLFSAPSKILSFFQLTEIRIMVIQVLSWMTKVSVQIMKKVSIMPEVTIQIIPEVTGQKEDKIWCTETYWRFWRNKLKIAIVELKWDL